MAQHRVLETPNSPAETAETAPQCPLSHRVARRVSTAIILVLCVCIAAISLFLWHSGA